jgi:phosphate-selective porin OprO/OprP
MKKRQPTIPSYKKTAYRLAVFVSTAGTLWALSPSTAAQETDSSEALKAQIRELDQKLRVLERKLELQQETATEKAKTAPVVSAGASGITVQTANSNFVLKIRGYAQADGRFFPDNPSPGNLRDTFLLRRVRPIFDGTFYDKYDYRLMFDFGQGSVSGSSVNNTGLLQDAYVNARLWPEFQIQVGKFKEPVGLERLQSGRNLLFVERGLPTLLVPNRDVGVQLQGELWGGKISYAAGVFNGVADGGNNDFDTDREKDVAARIFARPFKDGDVSALRGLGFGLAGTVGNHEGALRSASVTGSDTFFGYRTGVGTNAATANVVADGRQWRLSPQLYYYWGPFGLFAEYVVSDVTARRDEGFSTTSRLRRSAWQVAASYFLTGEDNGWDAVKVRKPFNLSDGRWGAWELAARIGQLDIDDAAFPVFANPATAASGVTEWAVALNWHLNSNLKINLNYSQADFDGGNSNPVLQEGLKTIFTRVQFAF